MMVMGIDDMGTTNSKESLCLEVVAKVMATVTHEVNNALAVMNEQAGYLDDLVIMVGDDGELPAERVKRSVQSIASQIGRTRSLMRDLNSFAHSGDEPVATIDLNQLVLTMIRLTERKAAAAEITVSMQSGDPVIVTTRPQLMHGLVFFCLSNFYEKKGHVGQTLQCKASLTEGDEELAELRFQVEGGQGSSCTALSESDPLAMLITELGAKIRLKSDSMVVQFPVTCLS